MEVSKRMEHNLAEYQKISKELEETYFKKNTDYENVFEESLNEYGVKVGAIRVTEKQKRIEQLSKSELDKESIERLEDSLGDLANYCIMTMMWLRENMKS